MQEKHMKFLVVHLHYESYIYIQRLHNFIVMKKITRESRLMPLRNSQNLGPENNVEEKMRHSPVITARISFGALGCLMFGTLLYTLLTDGSPFRKELLTP
ncbi:hypothetical protein TIFTF001_029670 [Ficus carica]|uniref:Uncharacterized protein n=1 Tax=Ficus carica TaxID=3494 RepID=A0AA88DSR5_FICCA|nr:hypothetical protein TIFTF001_029670 [Ficus carica]